jgi:hypothetical protein
MSRPGAPGASLETLLTKTAPPLAFPDIIHAVNPITGCHSIIDIRLLHTGLGNGPGWVAFRSSLSSFLSRPRYNLVSYYSYSYI